ncbi:glucose-induced degradation protein 8 [Nematocida minor]|uniref:glucose-induced degradation protein 8 n=1 Tax=Nematocida minor TaxID=1912983 RepID=UPI002220F100|nr:glucose-induced degradation protein 8 [Nematocida minor]KAI5192128.1 glucose-induced degradation protein 8 [Nematocida minor]
MYSMRVDDGKEEKTKKPADSSSLNKKILSMQIDKKETQKHIVEYFSEYGYHRAFCSFKKELDLDAQPAPLLLERDEIRNFSNEGSFLQIIETVKNAIPCIFLDHPNLIFSLLEQDILEDLYIRVGSESSALHRVEKELTPIVLENSALTQSLENLVSSIVFSQSSQEAVVANREAVFMQINKAMLLHLDYIMKDSIKLLLDDVETVSKQPEIQTIIKSCATLERAIKSLCRS